MVVQSTMLSLNLAGDKMAVAIPESGPYLPAFQIIAFLIRMPHGKGLSRQYALDDDGLEEVVLGKNRQQETHRLWL